MQQSSNKEYLQEFERRIKNAKFTTCDTNCMGLFFYALQIENEDTYISRAKIGPNKWDIKPITTRLEQLTEVETPQIGGGVVLYNGVYNIPTHGAVITDTNPVTVFYRREKNGRLEHTSLEEMKELYGFSREHKFFINPINIEQQKTA